MMEDKGRQRHRRQRQLTMAAIAVVAQIMITTAHALIPSFGSRQQRHQQRPAIMTLSSTLSSTKSTRLSALQAAAAASVVATTTTQANVIYDGPEWTSIQDCLGAASSSSYGCMTVVVGTLADDQTQKMVGIVAPAGDNSGGSSSSNNNNEVSVYQDSIAKLPPKIKDQDALNTMIAALTGVHCTAPRVQGVGGADASTDDNSMISGKVVILGGSEYACFAAEGLAALGSQVSLVSTNQKLSVRNKNVEIIPPAVGEDEIGFASFLGDFDALLDTADDERPSRRFFVQDDSDDNDDYNNMMAMGTTLRLLKQRHNCERYVSSMTKAQSIVNEEGVFFGPGKVKNHFQDIQKSLDEQPAIFHSIVPPSSFGKTVETLLEKDILYRNNKDFLSEGNKKSNPLVLRSWSLKDFMEVSMWPRDAAGGGSRMVRFGLPVLEEDPTDIDEDEEDFMISAPPLTADAKFIAREDWDKGIEKEEKEREDRDARNPFVKKIIGAEGMHDSIVKDQKDCVLFMSAAFCKTCKTLNPKFTYMARHSNEQGDGILFAKADATGDVGKDLGRLLKVDAVPAFLLFRNGRRFGPPLSISKIPSKKLDAAIAMLESGLEWDSEAIKQAEEKM